MTNELLFGFIKTGAPFALGITAAFFLLNLALVVFVGSKQQASRIFVFMSAITTLLVLTNTLGINVTDTVSDPLILFLLENHPRAAFFMGLVIGSSFLYFAYRFPDTEDRSRSFLLRLVILNAVVAPIIFFTDLIATRDTQWFDQSAPMPSGPFMYAFILLFAIQILYGIFLLYQKMRKSNDPLLKKQLLFANIGLSAGIGGTVIFDLVLPYFGIITFGFWGGFSTYLLPTIWVGSIAYSIMRYDQMNVKIVTAEVLVITALFLIFATIFI